MRKINAVIVLLVVLAACGASARTKTLQTHLVVLNAVRDTTLEVSRRVETEIFESATTKEEWRTRIGVWRAKVDRVLDGIANGYRVLDAAGALSDSKSANEAVAAVVHAVSLAKELKP